jgi:serine/threonine protein kinase
VPAPERGAVAVPGYEILEEMARGPTGIRRFRARQPLVGREVLLGVVLAREDVTQRAWSSLRSEAGFLGKLSHPHIVTLYDAGERDRQLFYNALEHLGGPTLAGVTSEEPLPIPEVIPLVEALARAVEFAHRRGVLHRHLEPAAVLLQPVAEARGGAVTLLYGEGYIPRLSGFGLPRRPVEGDPTDAELYAEPGFLSPEQAWGRTKELGPATDVYGLGGVLYALLTGRPPFRGPTLGDVLDAVQTAKLTSPSSHRAVPADLEWVCRKALARRPSARYATAGELADELQRVGCGRPPAALGVSAFGRLVRWVRRLG